jgi:putative N6-adenine-specific DNA methylase
LEAVLATELAGIGSESVEIAEGGVHFSGKYSLCYLANFQSRIASRILWRVAMGDYRTENDVFELARETAWEHWFTPSQSIRVDVSAIQCPLKSLDFATLRIKDAICDRFRAQRGARPTVDTKHPDIRIHAHLGACTATLYLDTSGEPLFKRGWRTETGESPIRENLAAGILRLSGWMPTTPLFDPMCGSGTFLVEAAQIALGIAPGVRRGFAFEKLENFDRREWALLRERGIGASQPERVLQIFGSDLYGRALKNARENIDRAGLAQTVSLKQGNVLEISAPAKEGILLTNLPYGVRSGESQELEKFYPRLGDALKQRFANWDAYLFTADLRLPKLIGLSASRRIPLYNGALECRLYEFKMVKGSNR